MEYNSRKSAGPDEINKQSRLITERKLADIVSEYADDFVGILNFTRQFVYINSNYLGNTEVIANLLGKRPGEVFGCIHANESEFGCGNSKACGYCGAVLTVTEALTTHRRISRDSKLLVGDGVLSTLNIRVTAIPIDVENEVFVLLFMKDISKEKRLELLEKAFFHDVLNTSISLQSLVAVSRSNPELIAEPEKSIDMNVSDIIEQISYFQKLKMAEDGELVVENSSVSLAEEISSLAKSLENSSISKGKNISLDLPEGDVTVLVDRTLLRRIVLNLVKNALEASSSGDEVRISLCEMDDECEISVKNSAVMTAEVKAQIFQRSFSTKGEGRGIGTYSIKILGERYLKGRVLFSSDEQSGTVFRLILPMM